MVGGGIGNALVGTLVIVAIATAISVPIGILAAVFLAEIGPDTRTATVVRFATKVLTGLPSILAGVFAFATVVLLTRRLFRAGGRRGPGGADAADHRPDGRGGHPHGAAVE